MTRSIDDVFDEEAEQTEIELDVVEVKSEGTHSDISDDYSFVREKLIHSIVRGSEIIDASVTEMKILSSARAVEAASGAVKSLTEASKALLDLHEKIRSIEKEAPKENEEDDKADKIILKSTLSDLIKRIDEESVTC